MVTIREVAKIAGVSMTTVSRAYNPNSVIKETTRQRIFKIAEEIGYSPNLSARGLVTNKKFIIGVFFSSIHTDMSTYLSDTLSNIHDMLPDEYLLSVEGIDRITNFDKKVKNRFDGILVVSQSTADDEFIFKLSNINIPAVVILRPINIPTVDNIYADDESGIKAAMKYIASKGHKKIGFISGRPTFEASIKRQHGVEIGCINNNMLLETAAVKIGDFSPISGHDLMNQILNLPMKIRPTCILCANDDMALGAIRACYEKNINIPKDISVMGFDNVSYSSLSTPTLTTINNPINEMASAGIQRLIELINHKNTEHNVDIIKTNFIPRESIGSIK